MPRLLCYETGFIIQATGAVFAISCPATNGIFPINQDLIDRVPPNTRRQGIGMTCNPDERGIDIYRASATQQDDGTYDPTSFVCGKFFFSLAEQDARKYFPKSFEKLPKPAVKKQRSA